MNRKLLIEEGRRLVGEQEASGWRLAEIVNELRADGMTHEEIGAEFGWKSDTTSRAYEKALSFHGKNLKWADVFRLVKVSEDDALAAVAISKTEGRAISATVETRRPEIKAIAAEISSLPEAEKEQVARELANDPGFMADALAEHGKQRTKERTPTHSPTPMEKAINTARLRIAISKAEQAAQSVLDGINRSDLDADDVASLERSSHRARVLADYIDAVLGVGDLDKALEEMLS